MVCHFPPGTSKWNKIERRLFSFITQNWRGRPLSSREAVVELIAHTTTAAGLVVRAELDTGSFQIAVKMSDADMAAGGNLSQILFFAVECMDVIQLL